ncbi:MAG TPA: hypothetical protein DCK76_03510 [Desulfotomaculum sp.]|nr:hypothetical protein [Desulfotomaculum sp.]HBY04783.1 hypothetical protein [Desulfotomaculum sp.]
MPYFSLQVSGKSLDETAYTNKIEVLEEPSGKNGTRTKEAELIIVQYFKDENTNMTKNYRNRLTGAVVSYLEQDPGNKIITVKETTRYPADIPWVASFGASALAIGILLSGFLFGSLSFTQVHFDRIPSVPQISDDFFLCPCSDVPACFGANGHRKRLVNLSFCRDKTLALLGADNHSFVIGRALLYRGFRNSSLYLKSFAATAVGAMVGTVLLWFMSDGFVSLENTTGLVKAISNFIPNTYALYLIRDAVFTGKIDNWYYNYAAPIVLAALSLIISQKIYQRKL